jgi:hypothetical protein
MADKYHSDTKEKIETIFYNPALQDSGDLESGTRTVIATSKPPAPDYITNLTTPNVPDFRVIVRKLCQRLNVYIDSFNAGATKLYYSVEVNGIERVTGNFISAGSNNPVSWLLIEGQFNLGTANTIEVFLWVDSGNAVISVCQLYQAVGSNTSTEHVSAGNILVVQHTGLISVGLTGRILGTGSPTFAIYPLELDSQSHGYRLFSRTGDYARATPDCLALVRELNLRAQGTVETDINYFTEMLFILRTLQ